MENVTLHLPIRTWKLSLMLIGCSLSYRSGIASVHLLSHGFRGCASEYHENRGFVFRPSHVTAVAFFMATGLQ